MRVRRSEVAAAEGVGWNEREKAKGRAVRVKLGAAALWRREDAVHCLDTWAVSRKAENMAADAVNSE